jgi:hypothetical protein
MALDEGTLKNTILYGVNGSENAPTADSIWLNIINALHKPPMIASMGQGDMDQVDYNEAMASLRLFYSALADVIATQVVTHIKAYGELNNSSYLQVNNTGGSESDPLNNIT